MPPELRHPDVCGCGVKAAERRGAVEGGREAGREGGKERGREGVEGGGREREEEERKRGREEGRGREVEDVRSGSQGGAVRGEVEGREAVVVAAAVAEEEQEEEEKEEEEEEELRRRVEQNRLRFPLVCKPLHDDGRPSSHELTLISGPASLAARRCVCVCVCV
jgi:hypothetical protein